MFDVNIHTARIMKREITPSEFLRVIENCSSKMLSLDCRPFPMYNKDHIKGSVNVFCPPIFKRRVASRGFVRLESVVSPDVRTRLRNGEYTTLVLYDENGECKDSSNIHLILQGLYKHSYSIKTICTLKGGFTSFRSKFPEHCDRSTSSNNTEVPVLDIIASNNTTSNIQNPPTELLPYLYIGDERHSSNIELLQRTGITSILNVSNSSPVHDCSQFAYKRIPIRDNQSENISTWFNEALQYIDSVRRCGGKILVHCKAGISRSATICIAYLMVHKSFTLDQAFDHVQSRREIISPNMSFMQQLFEFERMLLVSNMRTICMTSSQTIPPISCAQTTELSPSINMSTQFAF